VSRRAGVSLYDTNTDATLSEHQAEDSTATSRTDDNDIISRSIHEPEIEQSPPPLFVPGMICPHREKFFGSPLGGDGVVENIQPFIVKSSSAGGLIERSGRIDTVIDHRLFDVHEAIIPIDFYWDARQS
jgi:hypothetical protein